MEELFFLFEIFLCPFSNIFFLFLQFYYQLLNLSVKLTLRNVNKLQNILNFCFKNIRNSVAGTFSVLM